MKRLVLLAFALTACSPDLALPPAAALKATPQQLAAIPNLETGTQAVDVTIPAPLRSADRELRLRVVAPQATGPFPVVVFSHGFASDVDQYDALFRHWAAHGYLIVAPFHRDGGGTVRGILASVVNGKRGLIESRLHDIQTVLDHLDHFPQADAQRIALAGHSFGAFTAQQFGGAAAVDPDSGARVEGADARVRAVVAVSPPGRMFGLINEKSWLTMTRPMLVTTGTWDVDGRFVHEWREHALSFDTAPAGRNWLLVSEGADHYLGNLICRTQRKAAPQLDALRMLNAMSVTFLDAFVKDDAAARAFLEKRPLDALTGGFARLSFR